jgi:large subunit ribosomal protein L21
MYAIALSGGKQFKIEKDSIIRVPSLDLPVGEKIRLDQILLFNHDGKVEVGSPFVEGAYADARVVQQGRQRKITIIKYKRRKDYRRKLGHRQGFTEIVIDSIVPGSPKKAAAKKTEKKVAKPVKVAVNIDKTSPVEPVATKKEKAIPAAKAKAVKAETEKKEAKTTAAKAKAAKAETEKKETKTTAAKAKAVKAETEKKETKATAAKAKTAKPKAAKKETKAPVKAVTKKAKAKAEEKNPVKKAAAKPKKTAAGKTATSGAGKEKAAAKAGEKKKAPEKTGE